MTRAFRPVTEGQRAWMRKCFAIIARMGTADIYVYAHHDRSGMPVYIGLGRGGRLAASRLACAKKLGVSPDELTSAFIFRGLTRRVACELETGMIAEYGRQAEGGILINVAHGGNRPAPETVARAQAKRAAKMVETVAKRAATREATYADPNYVSPLKGRKQSPEHKASVQAAMAAMRADPNYVDPKKGRKADPVTIAKREATNAAKRLEPGYVHPNKGRKLAPAHVANVTAATAAARAAPDFVDVRVGRKQAPETVAKRTAAIAATVAARSPEAKAALTARHLANRLALDPNYVPRDVLRARARAAKLAPTTPADIATPLTATENA